MLTIQFLTFRNAILWTSAGPYVVAAREVLQETWHDVWCRFHDHGSLSFQLTRSIFKGDLRTGEELVQGAHLNPGDSRVSSTSPCSVCCQESVCHNVWHLPVQNLLAGKSVTLQTHTPHEACFFHRTKHAQCLENSQLPLFAMCPQQDIADRCSALRRKLFTVRSKVS